MTTTNKRHKCPKCGKMTAIKNGSDRGLQKYYCLNCRKFVMEKKNKYSKKVKMFLSAMLNMIFDLKNSDFIIQNLTSSEKEDRFNIDNIKIVSKTLKKDTNIECYNPALLFCLDYDSNEIVAYKFDRHFLQKTDFCEIKIVHDVENSKSHKEKLQNKSE